MAEESQPNADQSTDEPRLTPLQRVKQQQAMLRRNRNIGTQKSDTDENAPGAASGPNRRVELNRRSGSSGS